MTHARGPLGDVTRDAHGAYTLRFERWLRHPPERIWPALTDPEEARNWFMEMVLEPRTGGRVRIGFTLDEGYAEGEVLAWDPPRLLEYSWTEKGSTSRVRWELTPEGDGTRLALTHIGLAFEAPPYEYGAGWHDFLDRLARHLAGEPHPEGVEAFERLVREYRPLIDAAG